MLKENIEERCRRISPTIHGGKSDCAFAPSGAVGFIDTSSLGDGSRGIAFFGNEIYVNTDGAVRQIAYKNISNLRIISSFEDSFADELSVSGDGLELRISDYSLDKFELKCLLDELCKECQNDGQTEKYAEITAQKLAADALAEASEHTGINALLALSEKPAQFHKPPLPEKIKLDEALDDDPIPVEDRSPVIAETVIDIPKQRLPLPENYSPAPIPEESINWISGEKAKTPLPKETETARDQNHEKESEETIRPKPPVIMNGVIDRVPVMGERKPSSSSKSEKDPLKAFERKNEPSESEIRERIENMSSNEMMSFLSDTLNEINDTSAPFFEQTETPLAKYSSVPQTVPDHGSDADIRLSDMSGSSASEAAQESQAPQKLPSKQEKLTVEPIWGDIYIKASKNLRELCESGKLTMEQMESELKTHLINAAEAFEMITDDESKVPKVMIPKITELKAAAADFDRYFGYGEDIAVRAMFFMLYQMLTYADRIEESPETKDRLNDFFRRFGSAGITLSMLDMRV